MRGEVVYLDNSAIVKRYFEEPGSGIVREAYLRAYSGEVALSYSAWNVGEILGVLDRAKRTGRISEEIYALAKRRLLAETRRLAKLGILFLVPVRMKLLVESWRLPEKYHVYEADALQIASAKYARADRFLTGDERVHEIAQSEGLNSTYLG